MLVLPQQLCCMACSDRAAAADQAAEARLNGILASIKAQRTAQEDKEKQIAQIAKDMELARLQGENLLAERVGVS